MARGQTRKGRSRAALMAAVSSSRPLLKAHDHGEPVSIHAQDVGASGDRWVEPFLAANMAGLSLYRGRRARCHRGCWLVRSSSGSRPCCDTAGEDSSSARRTGRAHAGGSIGRHGLRPRFHEAHGPHSPADSPSRTTIRTCSPPRMRRCRVGRATGLARAGTRSPERLSGCGVATGFV